MLGHDHVNTNALILEYVSFPLDNLLAQYIMRRKNLVVSKYLMDALNNHAADPAAESNTGGFTNGRLRA
jgi:hypothetical protein